MWCYSNFISVSRINYIIGKDSFDNYLETNLPKHPWYPNYDITSYVKNMKKPDVKIAMCFAEFGYYLDRPFYEYRNNKKEIDQIENFCNSLKKNNITHVLHNNFVFKKRKLTDHWLYDDYIVSNIFQKAFESSGQKLYSIDYNKLESLIKK